MPFALLLALTLAQTPQFEVASIRPGSDDGHSNLSVDQGRMRTHNVSVKRLIARGYDIDFAEIFGGPAWVESVGFDINAKIPEGAATDMLPQMVQSLLADRFKLVIHREPRPVAGFELVVVKKGSKMQTAKPGDRTSERRNNTHVKVANETMESFCRMLTRQSGKLVIDKTGLPGGYNFELDFAPDNADPSDDRPSLFLALQEQLGLKLESAKVTIQAIVIDRAEKPEAN